MGERDLKSVASLIFYIYLTYLTYFDLTLPSFLTTTTTYNRYVPTHRLQNISSPLSHFPKLEELAWHGMLATAQVSLGGGGSIRDKSCPPHCSRCPSFAARRRHSEASERSR